MSYAYAYGMCHETCKIITFKIVKVFMKQKLTPSFFKMSIHSCPVKEREYYTFEAQELFILTSFQV